MKNKEHHGGAWKFLLPFGKAAIRRQDVCERPCLVMEDQSRLVAYTKNYL